MTPKEKAKELIEKYLIFTSNLNIAKKCALIAVDEILSVIPMYIVNLNPKWKYWQEVKQEIEKL